jgi:hypothetical protein
MPYAPFTDISYFVGETFLPNATANTNNINVFIKKYEQIWLNKVLGIAFAKLFIDGLANNPVDARWTALKLGGMYTYNGVDGLWLGFSNDTKQSPLANFVYYWYMRDQATQTTSGGETKASAENSKTVSSLTKMARAWNEMCDWQVNLICYLLANRNTYSEFIFDPNDFWQFRYNAWYEYYLLWAVWPYDLFYRCRFRLYEKQSITGI